MIHKIKKIDNFGVFTNFEWDKEVHNKQGNILSFKDINIIYGRNYSGKTTLSRIFRSMETGRLPDNFETPSFSVEFDDNKEVMCDSLSSHGKEIRVFNNDFIRENLRFINNPEEEIESFAILGEGNNKIEQEIAELEAELGSKQVGEETGLYEKDIQLSKNNQQIHDDWISAKNELDNLLKKKATDREMGIKYNSARFGDQNYDKSKLIHDIEIVSRPEYVLLSAEQISENEKQIKETSLPPIYFSNIPRLQFSLLCSKTQALVVREISASNKIEELVKDAILNRWVKEGRSHHDKMWNKCAFCGNLISEERWNALDRHFDEASELLEQEIELVLKEISRERNIINNITFVNKEQFYSRYHAQLDKLNKTLQDTITIYRNGLESLGKQLETRKDDILHIKEFELPEDCSTTLKEIWDSYKTICDESNAYTSSLEEERHKAQGNLRLAEVYKFQAEINYQEKNTKILGCEEKYKEAEQEKIALEKIIQEKETQIITKKLELNDEEEGAKKVNEYLNDFFGHHFLSLRAKKDESADDDAKKHVRFEIIRNNKKAYHLSEGECSLLAFCYFLAKLDDVNTHNQTPIIWIDDPISSLDGNHIFFVYSLIRTKIVEVKRFEQLFISTHNLEFLKYLKRLTSGANKKAGEKQLNSSYFIVSRIDKQSTINIMPNYLKNYVTEFNYLFERIYKCAQINSVDDTNYTIFYNFGNDARKFLEIYLYYKYPDNSDPLEKLPVFFEGDMVPAVLVGRINNEYSHLSGVFERGETPVEVPEMKKAAQQILDALKKDKDQYNAFLKSIGVTEETQDNRCGDSAGE